jgi:hypothetical protein
MEKALLSSEAFFFGQRASDDDIMRGANPSIHPRNLSLSLLDSTTKPV